MSAKAILTAILPGIVDRIVKSPRTTGAAAAVAAAAVSLPSQTLPVGETDQLIAQAVLYVAAVCLALWKDSRAESDPR